MEYSSRMLAFFVAWLLVGGLSLRFLCRLFTGTATGKGDPPHQS